MVPEWTQRALKDLDRVPPGMKAKVKKIADRLDAEPSLGPKLKGKLAGLRSAHVGRSYRLIYESRPEGPVVLAVQPRRDAYR